jgi:hypothetical protein
MKRPRLRGIIRRSAAATEAARLARRFGQCRVWGEERHDPVTKIIRQTAAAIVR